MIFRESILHTYSLGLAVPLTALLLDHELLDNKAAALALHSSLCSDCRSGLRGGLVPAGSTVIRALLKGRCWLHTAEDGDKARSKRAFKIQRRGLERGPARRNLILEFGSPRLHWVAAKHLQPHFSEGSDTSDLQKHHSILVCTYLPPTHM